MTTAVPPTTTAAPTAAPTGAPRGGPPPLRQIALGDLEHELATTRRVLERVPTAHLGYKPHEKSFTLQQLAAHTANISGWGTTTMTTDALDFAQPMEQPALPTTTEELVAAFDAGAARLRAAIEGASDEALRATWTARRGERVIFALPRVGVLRGFIVSHLIHHRAQLGVYLRLLDLPVPSMYGPTADEGTF